LALNPEGAAKQFIRFLTGGSGVLAFYVGGVWVGTDILNLPVRPVNISLYIISVVFSTRVNAKKALALFLLWQCVGIILNTLWVEAGLRMTNLYPWVIAASFFTVWPFLSFNVQRRYIFK